MTIRLLFIIMVIFSVGAVVKMVNQLIGFIENNSEILVASQEINTIVKVVYTDYLISGRSLNTMSQKSFAAYLRKRIKSIDRVRDPAKDPWLIPYRITIRNGDSYEIRSAGPDLEFNTEDDIFSAGG
ncbi:hypothetical protein CCP3SC5AM1_90026 [Gammaproteobacteria bacterium]